ncbi:MAG: hypothetical protein IIW08_05350 [Clostridia bacterium]|nr:hypothetical protein [Clostridia bacterium]MBQ5770585.1 hypothetical protein [Clostridia bacterium]
MFRKIPCDWFLTDGILSDIRLGAPLKVMDALLRAGVVKDDGKLVSRLNREWVFRRSWRYLTTFQAPAYEGVRTFLVLDGLTGRYTIYLNGTQLKTGDSDNARVEVTGCIKEKENTLEIEFEPEDNSVMVPAVGLSGQMLLYDSGETTISAVDVQYDSGDCMVTAEINALSESEIQLAFELTANGETAVKKIYKDILPGKNLIECVPFKNVPSGKVQLELKIKKDEITSDSVNVVKHAPDVRSSVRGFQVSDAFGMAITARAGGNSVVTPMNARAFTLAADRGLTAYVYGKVPVNVSQYAVSRMETLMELAGGDASVLEKEALWRLSGIREDVFRPCVAAYGENAPIEKKIDVSRYLQAVSIRSQAESARLRETPFVLGHVRDNGRAFASRALFDHNDRPRPAYYAIMQAWRKEHAFAVQPEGSMKDGLLTIPVYYVCDEGAEPATVTAVAYSLTGEELMAANFPVVGMSPEAIGRLCVEKDETDFVVVRVRVMRNGECVSKTDSLIAPEGGTLNSIGETQILVKDSAVENVGDVAAVGVCVPGAEFFGCLLPGESLPVAAGRPGYTEGLNIIL